MGLNAVSGRKVENHPQALAAKVEIRERVMAAIGGPKRARVFDAFAAHGALHKAVWHKAAHYVGCELSWVRDGRMMFAADNRRVLRAIDLDAFNIFDLDSFGSPWEQALIVADRRPVRRGEKVGIILTEGSGLSLVGNSMPRGLSEIAGLKSGIVGQRREIDAVISRAIAGLAARMSCDLLKRWQAVRGGGSRMAYIGLVMSGRGNSRQITPSSISPPLP